MTRGYDNLIKVITLGDSGSGKTQFVRVASGKKIIEDYSSTTGIVFSEKNFSYDGKNFKYQFWDTAGQEKYRCLTPSYYRDANVALIFLNISNPINNLDKWLSELDKNVEKNIIKFIVITHNSDAIDVYKFYNSIRHHYEKFTRSNFGLMFLDLSKQHESKPNIDFVFENTYFISNIDFLFENISKSFINFSKNRSHVVNSVDEISSSKFGDTKSESKELCDIKQQMKTNINMAITRMELLELKQYIVEIKQYVKWLSIFVGFFMIILIFK